MHDHALSVGEELVIQGHIRLIVLKVEEDEVFLGIVAEPNSVEDPMSRQFRLRLVAVPASSSNENGCSDGLS
jgi:hypothetical protein